MSRKMVWAVPGIVLFLVVASAVALSRNSGSPFVDILYAEDGTVFFTEARTLGMGAVWEPYAGYLHLVSRLAGGAFSVLSVGQVAAAYSVFAAGRVGVLALQVFFTSRVLLSSWPSRALLVAAMVIPPLAGQTVGNLSNLHWYLMFAAFWAVISNPRNVQWTVAGVAIAATAAPNDPLTALLLPSAALAIFHYRSRLHGFVVVAMVAGLAAPLLVVLAADQNPPVDSSWTDLPALYAFRVAGGIMIEDVPLTSA